MTKKIVIATRKSPLALWQANFVKSALEKKYPDYTITLREMITAGDQQQTIALSAIGGKSVFVKALQQALRNHEADIAVHSVKDMSVQDTEDLQLAAICERADPRDAFVSNNYHALNELPKNAIVGTSSPRRASFIQSLRPDVQIKLLRGNVDTRLAKLDAQQYDAIILAAAGLHRLQLSSRIRDYFSVDDFIPAIGQGAVGIECRGDDTIMRDLLGFLHHPETAQCVIAERAVNQIIGGDCDTAIGAHATILQNKMQLTAMVGSLDGQVILRANAEDTTHHAKKLGKTVADILLAQGAKELIHHA